MTQLRRNTLNLIVGKTGMDMHQITANLLGNFGNFEKHVVISSIPLKHSVFQRMENLTYLDTLEVKEDTVNSIEDDENTVVIVGEEIGMMQVHIRQHLVNFLLNCKATVILTVNTFFDVPKELRDHFDYIFLLSGIDKREMKNILRKYPSIQDVGIFEHERVYEMYLQSTGNGNFGDFFKIDTKNTNSSQIFHNRYSNIPYNGAYTRYYEEDMKPDYTYRCGLFTVEYWNFREWWFPLDEKIVMKHRVWSQDRGEITSHLLTLDQFKEELEKKRKSVIQAIEKSRSRY